jgi:hypothetical protein
VGADVNVNNHRLGQHDRDRIGHVPGDSQTTRSLIAADFDINDNNSKGKSALSYAKDNKAQK